uniref:Uncharacterized protein n=1 Tax=Grammatophora oceanica TaxID=210454 RepID=A0A7S1YII2_9STRA
MRLEAFDGPAAATATTSVAGDDDESDDDDDSSSDASSMRSKSPASFISRSSSLRSSFSRASGAAPAEVASDLYDTLYSSAQSSIEASPVIEAPTIDSRSRSIPLPPPPKLPRASVYPKKQKGFDAQKRLMQANTTPTTAASEDYDDDPPSSSTALAVGFDSDDGTELKDNTRLKQDPNYRHSLRHIQDCIWAALGDDSCESLDLGTFRIDKDSTKAIKEESDDQLDTSTLADDEEEEGWLSTEDPWERDERSSRAVSVPFGVGVASDSASYTTDGAVMYTTQRGQPLPSAKEIIRAAHERMRMERSQTLQDNGDDPLDNTQPRRNTSSGRSESRSRYAEVDRSGRSSWGGSMSGSGDRSRRSRESGGSMEPNGGSPTGSYGSYLTGPREYGYYDGNSSTEEDDDREEVEQHHDAVSQYDKLGVQYRQSDAGEEDEFYEGYNASAELAKEEDDNGEQSEEEVDSSGGIGGSSIKRTKSADLLSVESVAGDQPLPDVQPPDAAFTLAAEETTPLPPSLPYSNDAVVEYTREDIDDDISSLGSHLTVLVSTARRRQELQLEKERVEVELKKLELKNATRRRSLLMPTTMSTAQRLAEAAEKGERSPKTSVDPRAARKAKKSSPRSVPFPLVEISVDPEVYGVEQPVDDDGEEKSIYDTSNRGGEHPSPVSVLDSQASSQSTSATVEKEEWGRCNRQLQEEKMYPPKLDRWSSRKK